MSGALFGKALFVTAWGIYMTHMGTRNAGYARPHRPTSAGVPTVSVGGDASLFDFATEIPGWFPWSFGGLPVDLPSLPLSPIILDSLDDYVIVLLLLLCYSTQTCVITLSWENVDAGSSKTYLHG